MTAGDFLELPFEQLINAIKSIQTKARARRPVATHQGTGARHEGPHASTASTEPRPTPAAERAPTDVEYDAVVVGAGFGGLAAATQLAVAGAKVVVLER